MMPWNVATVWITLMKRCHWEAAQPCSSKCCFGGVNAHVYFEPGSTDPLTMPYYSCCIAGGADAGLIISLMDVGVDWMLCPAYRLHPDEPRELAGPLHGGAAATVPLP
ncbi:hypothetical protein I79_002224 [Cricetulus griseus]|uniref:Uncharacterized protein n=1 Tax=Cricetulus griseus TaxID=10029 RepID=G3GWU1_CRIGR|nr:hypothetical protein I79_002224 [Cricetulus griseus]